MTKKLNRRKFIVTIGTLAAALPLGASAFDFIPSAGKSFNFLLLGDIHYDKWDFHDIEYVRTKFGDGDVVQIKNYSRIAQENFPLLVKVSKEKAINLNADFYLQLGDFVEGLCGSEQLATTQTNAFISFMQKQDINRPFFAIKGNHDITGVGARETFAKVVLPWQSKQQQKQLSNANSTFVHKNARFILFDGYTPDQSLAWLKEVLANHKEKTLFFCVHQPVVPFNARANWHLFGKPNQQKQREELLDLLGMHNAIVLCGHLHKTSILSRNTAKGRFVQICTGSVIEGANAPIKDHLDGLKYYGENLVNLEPNFSPKSLQERKDNLNNEKPYLTYFEYADFMGYSTVSVSSKGKVEMSIYANFDKTPWKVINVSNLFKG